MKFGKAAVAAIALAVAPLTVSAATITPAGGPYDVTLDSYNFSQEFAAGSSGGTYIFNFFNSSTVSSALTVASATIRQLSAYFAGGVTTEWVGGPSHTTGNPTTDGFDLSTVIAANGGTAQLKITFGNVVDKPSPGQGTANIDFDVIATVPLPAGGLLLVGALGGLAALRRRKMAA